MQVLLFASGKQERWGDTDQHKQLLWVDDAPLLVRTIKQLLARDCYPIVVTPHEKIKACIRDNLPLEDVGILDVGSPELMVDTIAATIPHWIVGETNLALFADVFFSDAAMETIVSGAEGGLRFFGRSTSSPITGNRAAEVFGWSWRSPDDDERLIAGIDAAREHAKANPGARDLYGTPVGGVWQMRRSIVGLPLSTTPTPLADWVEINDFTDDFDTPESYTRWLAEYRKRIICQPRFTRHAA